MLTIRIYSVDGHVLIREDKNRLILISSHCHVFFIKYPYIKKEQQTIFGFYYTAIILIQSKTPI